MRAFVQRSLAFALVGFAAVLSAKCSPKRTPHRRANATTAAEPPEEVTVRGRRTMTQYRLELERARNEIFRIFNEANEGTDNDIQLSRRAADRQSNAAFRVSVERRKPSDR